MVMTFTFTPLSHYNIITKPRVCFLLSILEDLSIDFPFHFITSILDVYLDTATCDKLIFTSAITHILTHFHIPITSSAFFTTISAISADFVWRSEAQLRLKRPRVERTDLVASIVPPSSLAPFTAAANGVTLEAIMAHLQWMEVNFGGHLDYLTDKICQMNSKVGRIARR